MRPTHAHRPVMFALALAATAAGRPLLAQVTEVTRRPIADVTHLTFGNLCEDRFVIRNDGPTAVSLEYAVAKGTQHFPLTLAGRELVELESKAKEPLELWVDGKLVAQAEKEGRKCRDVQGNSSVAVAALNPVESRDERRGQSRGGIGLGFGLPYYDPWYSPFGYGYGFGMRPYYSGFYGIPIIIGGGMRTGGGRRR